MLVQSLVRLVDLCRRRAAVVALAGLAGTVLLGGVALERLGIDTDTAALLSSELPWRQRQAEFNAAFPRLDDSIAVVVEAATPERAEAAATTLTRRLASQPSQFRAVWRPDGGEFFQRNGLLYLSPEELTGVADKLIQAQPLIGGLAADPSLRGLFDVLALALDGVARGAAALSDLEASLAGVADAAEAALAGRQQPLSWQTLLTGRAAEPRQLRRVIQVQPVIDFAALEPGGAASMVIRRTAEAAGLTPEAGVRVRLTGEIALADEEFASVAEGARAAIVITFAAVLAVLFVALRSWRTITAILITLVAGLAAAAAFATAAVGSLNLISVAFVVLYVGIAVDFGIQFSVRFRDERYRSGDLAEALRRSAAGMGAPLVLAATATAAGFFSLVPTDYVGIAELGLIAGAGMLIAVVLDLTLLPALLALLRPPAERAPVGFAWAAPVDRFLLRRCRPVAAAAVAIGLAALTSVPRLDFDFNPLNLKDPNTESVATLFDLIADGSGAPFTAAVVAPSPAAAAALAERMEALPEIDRAVSLASFVPREQAEKLAILEDARLLLGVTLNPVRVAAPPSDGEVMAAIAAAVEKLDAVVPKEGGGSSRRLAEALHRVLERGGGLRALLESALLDGLTEQLAALRLALSAHQVTLDDLPRDLKEAWMAADGRARVALFPNGDASDTETLRRFVAAVQAAVPEATGAAVSIHESARSIVDAFITAGILAFVAIAVLLAAVLRRPLDVLLVLAPLVLAGVLTMATTVVIGLALNFANIIALPLLFGIGVAFDIYFVMNWRAGLEGPLQSSTARAVLFSALTTAAAFGSLGLSSHPGTAGMGTLLAIELGYVLFCTLAVLPALFGLVKR